MVMQPNLMLLLKKADQLLLRLAVQQSALQVICLVRDPSNVEEGLLYQYLESSSTREKVLVTVSKDF